MLPKSNDYVVGGDLSSTGTFGMAPQPTLVIGRKLYNSMCMVCWYNTTALRTWPVLVHYSVVVNPRRPERAGCGSLTLGPHVLTPTHFRDMLVYRVNQGGTTLWGLSMGGTGSDQLARGK